MTVGELVNVAFLVTLTAWGASFSVPSAVIGHHRSLNEATSTRHLTTVLERLQGLKIVSASLRAGRFRLELRHEGLDVKLMSDQGQAMELWRAYFYSGSLFASALVVVAWLYLGAPLGSGAANAGSSGGDDLISSLLKAGTVTALVCIVGVTYVGAKYEALPEIRRLLHPR